MKQSRALSWPVIASVTLIGLLAGAALVRSGFMQAASAPNIIILDDGKSGYSEAGLWRKPPAALGYGGTERGILGKKTAGMKSDPGEATATWTTQLGQGVYEIFVTWQQPPVGADQLAKQVPFRITGSTKNATKILLIDQSKEPQGPMILGRPWQPLGTFMLTSVVTIDTSNINVSGAMLADAVLIRRVSGAGPAPSGPTIPAPSSQSAGSDMQADLEVLQSIQRFSTAPSPVIEPGGPLEYTLSIRNRGPGPATLIDLKDQFPPEFVPALPKDPRCMIAGTTQKTLSCRFPSLPAGKQILMLVPGTVSLLAHCDAAIVNRAGAKAHQNDSNPVNNLNALTIRLCGAQAVPSTSLPLNKTVSSAFPPQAAVPTAPVIPVSPPISVSVPLPTQTGPADFSIRMVTRATVAPGGEISGTIELKNTGKNSAPASLTITLPSGVTLKAGSIEGCEEVSATNGVIACSLGVAGPGLTMPVVRFVGIVSLSASCGAPLTVRVQGSVPQGDGTPENNAVLSSSKVQCS